MISDLNRGEESVSARAKPREARFTILVVWACLIWQASQCTLAKAQDPGDSQIDFTYVEPKNFAFRPYYEELKRRKVLEELQEFLSPLRLPRRVLVETEECGANPPAYEPGKPIIVCYEYVAQLVKLAPVDKQGDISRENAIIGAFVQYVLHEMSHAIFDLLEVPVWGRENDAADNLAAFVMLQFGKDVAVRTLTATLWYFEASERTWTDIDFARETSPEAQRFYNYLCISYGGDPDTFADIARATLMKTSRAASCAHEYLELSYAFRKTILPHIDPDRLRKTQSMEWAKPEK